MRAQLSASLLYPLQMIDAERRRVRGIALVLIVACGLLSGCAAEPRVENTSQALDLDQVPQSRVNNAMIACLADKGWSARMDWGGTIDYGPVPDSQRSVLRSDAQACSEESGWGDLTRFSVEQINDIYDLEVATYQCLLALGKSPTEPPTRQRYVDTFGTAEQYYAIRDIPADPSTVKACPPPTWFLNF